MGKGSSSPTRRRIDNNVLLRDKIVDIDSMSEATGIAVVSNKIESTGKHLACFQVTWSAEYVHLIVREETKMNFLPVVNRWRESWECQNQTDEQQCSEKFFVCKDGVEYKIDVDD